jgi:hypothetical protein
MAQPVADTGVHVLIAWLIELLSLVIFGMALTLLLKKSTVSTIRSLRDLVMYMCGICNAPKLVQCTIHLAHEAPMFSCDLVFHVI